MFSTLNLRGVFGICKRLFSVSQIKGRQEREKAGRKKERRKKGRKEEEREGGKRGFRGDIWERRAAFIFEE